MAEPVNFAPPMPPSSAKRLRWRLQEFLNGEGVREPISAADRLLDLLVNELLAEPPNTPANRFGNELRRG